MINPLPDEPGSSCKTYILATSHGFQEAEVEIEEKGGIAEKDIQTLPPLPPAAPPNPLLNLPGAIRQYLKARKIWQTRGARFIINDEHSRQVRRDTVRFRIDKRDRLGK